ncbi:hypothetical protein HK104_005434 [Borealophlyctis nickersoniae]|nr:hypothetical protein HK104_005434 [Borealophlyctis nickersoniae]
MGHTWLKVTPGVHGGRTICLGFIVMRNCPQLVLIGVPTCLAFGVIADPSYERMWYKLERKPRRLRMMPLKAYATSSVWGRIIKETAEVDVCLEDDVMLKPLMVVRASVLDDQVQHLDKDCLYYMKPNLRMAACGIWAAAALYDTEDEIFVHQLSNLTNEPKLLKVGTIIGHVAHSTTDQVVDINLVDTDTADDPDQTLKAAVDFATRPIPAEGDPDLGSDDELDPLNGLDEVLGDTDHAVFFTEKDKQIPLIVPPAEPTTATSDPTPATPAEEENGLAEVATINLDHLPPRERAQ